MKLVIGLINRGGGFAPEIDGLQISRSIEVGRESGNRLQLFFRIFFTCSGVARKARVFFLYKVIKSIIHELNARKICKAIRSLVLLFYSSKVG